MTVVRRKDDAPVAYGEADLLDLQKATFRYFLDRSNPANGMVADSTRQGAFASIAAVAFALTSYPIGVERGYITRDDAASRTLTTLRFFRDSEQGLSVDATGHRGFYYHFLDMQSGRRAGRCELSTIDSAFLFAGFLAAATFFDRDDAVEQQIRAVAQALFARADWHWALDGGLKVSHGWTPERGFLKYRWDGYSEALILYLLGLASPTFPLPAESYEAFTHGYKWKKLYGFEFVYAGPLFIHQLSHLWTDFRAIQDVYMRSRGIDYFENTRRATYVQQAYAIRNSRRFTGYGPYGWGITASDGPGPARRRIDGVERRFFDYRARGVPSGPDDGTLAPWAVVASLPFAPELVLPTMAWFDRNHPKMTSGYGFKCSYNPSFDSVDGGSSGWVSKGYYGLDQGPVVMMIENFLGGFLWRLMRRCEPLRVGLRRAGFAGGWLDETGSRPA